MNKELFYEKGDLDWETKNQMICCFPSHPHSTCLSPTKCSSPTEIGSPTIWWLLGSGLECRLIPHTLTSTFKLPHSKQPAPIPPLLCCLPQLWGQHNGEPHQALPSSRPVFMPLEAWPHLQLLTACLPHSPALSRACAPSLSPCCCSLDTSSVIITANED